MPRNFNFIKSLSDDFFLTVRRAHLINLFELLVTSLSARNYCRANRIVEILLQCPEVDITHVWKAAMGVLLQLGSAERTCMDFFNRMLLHTKCKEEVLLELISFQIYSGNPQDALETLETYLPQQPYKDNPLIIGYTGMLALALWEQTNVIIDDIESGEVNEDHDFEQCVQQRARYYILSINSLKTALDMDGANDMFLTSYVKLLLANDIIDEALDIVRNFYAQNPQIIVGYRLLFDILYNHRNGDIEWVQAGKSYHKIDPVSPPQAVLNPLIKYYENMMDQAANEKSLAEAHYNILELLFQRIENGDDNFEYVRDAITHFTWLEFFDPLREFIDILLKDRVGWIHKFLWFPNGKTITNWKHLQYYRILAVFCGEKSQGMIVNFANKLKYYILTGQTGKGLLKVYLKDFRENKFRENIIKHGYKLSDIAISGFKSDQSDSEVIISENEDDQLDNEIIVSRNEDGQLDNMVIISEDEDC